MQEGAHKAVAAVSVIITSARPASVVGKDASMRSSSCTACAISVSRIDLTAPDPGNEFSLSRAGGIRIAAHSRENNRLDQARVVVLDVAHPRKPR